MIGGQEHEYECCCASMRVKRLCSFLSRSPENGENCRPVDPLSENTYVRNYTQSSAIYTSRHRHTPPPLTSPAIIQVCAKLNKDPTIGDSLELSMKRRKKKKQNYLCRKPAFLAEKRISKWKITGKETRWKQLPRNKHEYRARNIFKHSLQMRTLHSKIGGGRIFKMNSATAWRWLQKKKAENIL